MGLRLSLYISSLSITKRGEILWTNKGNNKKKEIQEDVEDDKNQQGLQ